MGLATTKLTQHLNELLKPEALEDYCPNGLQVEGKDQIQRLVTGVTACQALLDKAVMLKADAILVHHGYFWRGEPEPITGMKKQRLATLLNNNINLYGYHLPLDAHSEYGNNVQLGQRLGFNNIKQFDAGGIANMAAMTTLDVPMNLSELNQHIDQHLERNPLSIAGYDPSTPIKRIAWCTGGAQDFITEAKAASADVFISGEISERTTHLARELGIHYIAAGHHATERYGVLALGQHLNEQFDLDVHFVDIDNPA